MEKKNMPLGMVIGRILQEMFRVLRKRASETSDVILTSEQFELLHVMNMKKEICVQQDFANLLGKDKSAILRLINSLENKKLVTRVVDVNDRRKNCMYVTDLGKEVNQHYINMEAQISKELTEGISVSDMEAFNRVISTIRSNVERI